MLLSMPTKSENKQPKHSYKMAMAGVSGEPNSAKFPCKTANLRRSAEQINEFPLEDLNGIILEKERRVTPDRYIIGLDVTEVNISIVTQLNG